MLRCVTVSLWLIPSGSLPLAQTRLDDGRGDHNRQAHLCHLPHSLRTKHEPPHLSQLGSHTPALGSPFLPAASPQDPLFAGQGTSNGRLASFSL